MHDAIATNRTGLPPRSTAALRLARLRDLLGRIDRTPPEEFDLLFHQQLAELVDGLPQEEESRSCFRTSLGHHFLQGDMQRRTIEKPQGYAGDYLTIDWMYEGRLVDREPGRSWDAFYHRQHAARAVCARKEFFVTLVHDAALGRPRGLSVLDLGCGPCRGLLDAARIAEGIAPLRLHGVDNDPDAIAYARRLCAELPPGASLLIDRANAVRFKPADRYDLIWSGGLFDYLPERVASKLLARLWNALAPGGRLCIGNFHPDNPTRRYMEWCMDWHLIHRDEAAMHALFTRAGIDTSQVSLQRDTTGALIYGMALR